MGLIKIGILLFSSLYTYLPFIILCILALCAYDTENHIAVWIIILTMPFGSLLNPFVTTLLPLTLQFRHSKLSDNHTHTFRIQQSNKDKNNGNKRDFI
jgi:hypothetical protein